MNLDPRSPGRVRRRRHCCACCRRVCVSARLGRASGRQAPLPRVHFVATGGTISNKDGGRLTAEELAKSMPGVERYARLTHEQFANVASSELTLAQWLGLSKRINELFASDKELAGIVVTSGTDTLEETAFFLHLTVRDPRPVVVVGSMRNPEHGRLRRRRQPARGRARGGRSGVAQQGRAGRAERRDQLGAQRHQVRRAAAADLPEPRIRPARRRRSRSRRVLQPDRAAAQRADRVRHQPR